MTEVMRELEFIQDHKERQLEKWWNRIQNMHLGVEESFLPDLATVLENQRLLNETFISEHEQIPIEVAAKMYSKSFARELVSFQSMTSPADLSFYLKHVSELSKPKPDDSDPVTSEELLETIATQTYTPEVKSVLHSYPVAGKTRKLKYPQNTEIDIEEMSTDIANEITREIIKDIENNCGTEAETTWTDAYGVYSQIMILSRMVYKETLSGTNWIYTSEFLGKELMKVARIEPIDMSGIGIYKVGKLGRWTIYVDKLFKKENLILGFRDREIDGNPYWQYNSGYAYCPYMPLAKTPRVVQEGFYPRLSYLTRYAKRLHKDGRKYYAKITFSEVPND